MSAGRGRAAEVVIPHWNRAESLRRALEALRAQTVIPAVTVVDNGSSDGSREMLAREFAEVRCIPLDSNRGFGAAVNRGVAAARAGLVVLLNNDTVADPSFVERLLAAADCSPAAAFAACLRSMDGTIESLGVEVDRSLVAYDVWYGEPYERAEREPAPSPLGPSGGAAAYRREALAAIGDFDEGFFAYLEDVDLAIRMRAAGLACEAVPGAFAWHEHSATLGSGAAAKNRLMGRSRGYLLWKHRGRLGALDRARGLVIDGVTYAGQAAIDRNLGAVRGRREIRRELARRPRPSAAGARVPVARRSVGEALRLRLARRRPAPPGRPRP